MANSRTPGPVCVSRSQPIDRGTLCLQISPKPGPTGGDFEVASEQGLRIVLTPIQLAAVLSGESFDEAPSPSSRLWGLGKLAAGAFELIGASGLLLAPEPTALTKVAGVALGAHGIDTTSSGLRQLVSGRDTATLASGAARSLSASLGADPGTAEMIGVGADLAIPLIAGGIGVLRVLAVRRGAISLVKEESAGGHTILKHVGQTEQQLRTRLATETRIPAHRRSGRLQRQSVMSPLPCGPIALASRPGPRPRAAGHSSSPTRRRLRSARASSGPPANCNR